MCAASASSYRSSSSSAVYRIFHATDLHFHVLPTWREVITEPKRLIGLFNMYVLGRRSRFSLATQQQIVHEVQRHRPSDLTSFATAAEFELAFRTLQPILGRRTAWIDPAEKPQHEEERAVEDDDGSASSVSHCTLVIPGNHDVYTFAAARERLFDRWFGPWRPPTGRVVQLEPHLRALAMDPCQPNHVSSNGHYDPHQLSAVSSALASPSLSASSTFLLLLTHYPVLAPDGSDYTASHRFHGVDNGAAMIRALRSGLSAFLSDSASRCAAMLLHGHVHKGYAVAFPVQPEPSSSRSASVVPVASASSPAGSLPLSGLSTSSPVSVPIENPGSAGRSFSASSRRAAAYNVYTITREEERSGDDLTHPPQPTQLRPSSAQSTTVAGRSPTSVHRLNGWSILVERFVHNGHTFEPEQPPYSSGY